MSQRIQIASPIPGYLQATFSNPPINLIDPELIVELAELVSRLESDPSVKVVTFKSADPEFFLAHYDIMVDRERAALLKNGPTGMPAWPDVLVRLTKAPAVSIAAIRGRARGAGSELVLSCDMRFASLERAVLSQFEVGLGAVPGGNPMVRLAELMGRGRALEIVLGGNDFSGSLAERYGYVNRALPDGELDEFVEQFAIRLASFEKATLAEIKHLVNEVSLPDDSVFPHALDAYRRSTANKASQEKIASLLQRGLQTRSEVEFNLGLHMEVPQSLQL